MSERPVSKLLDAIRDATGCEPKRNGRGWKARCPAHDDRQPSLSIAEGGDGRVLLRCHAGCPVEDIVSALRLEMRDLMPVDMSTVDKTHHSTPPKGVLSTIPKTKTPTTYATANEAIAQLESQLGKRTVSWPYHNAMGEPVGVMVRWNTADGSKTIRPVSHNSSGWIIGGMTEPRPLYGLPELASRPNERVYITEGEKAADAARSIELLATTSPHGSSSAGKADWLPLAGRDIVLLPDNDDAGTHYANDVTRILGELNPPAIVRVVTLPDLPPGGDAVEFITAQRAADLDDNAIRSAIESLADAADAIEFERPVPNIETYRPFPIEALPEPVRSFITDGATALGCDASYVALPLLAGLASAIGNARRIQLKPGWTEPAILWVAIVGDSGTMKSPAIELALQPIRDRQRKAMRQYGEKMEAYQTELTIHDRAMADWKRCKDNTDPPTKPEPPIADRCWCDDTTIESLAVLLQNQWRGLLVVRDELSGWVASFDRYAQGKGGDVAKWLEMFGARPMVIDRKTGSSPTTYIDRAAVCLVGGIQPGVLRRSLGTQHRENGLAARLLMAYPPRRAKRWTEANIAPATKAAMDNVFDRLFGLDPGRDDNGDPTPRNVELTYEGQQTWVAFYDEHNTECVELTGDLASVASKLEGYAARLALVVHFVRWAADDPTLADPNAVDETSIAVGVSLTQWFMSEARRVYGILGESEDDGQLRQLIELIERNGGEVTTRNLIRSSRMFLKTADAEAAIDKLVAAGFGRWEEASPNPKGGRPSKRFILTYKAADSVDVDDTHASAIENGGIVNVNTVGTPDDATPKIDSPQELPQDRRAEFEERSAILECDAGLNRADAEAEAFREILARMQAAGELC